MNTQPTQTAPKAAYTGDIPNTPIKFMWHSVKPFWPWLALGMGFNALTQILNTYTAVFVGNFTNAARFEMTPETFGVWAIWFVGLLSFIFICFRLAGFIAIKVLLKQHARAFDLVREYLFKHSHTYFIDRFAGTLAGKVFHAGDRSGEMLLMTYYGFTRLVTSLVSTGVVFLFFNVWLAVVYFLILAFTVVVNWFLVQRRRPHVVAYAEATSRYRGQITDVATNVQAVRQYAALTHESKWLRSVQDDRILKDRTQWMMSEWNHVINNVIAVGLMIVMVGGVYWLVVTGREEIGAMVTVMVLMYRVSGIILDIGDWMNRLVRVHGEVEEGLQEILVDYEITDVSGAPRLVTDNGMINWKNVNFEFGENKVFKDFNLKIKPGQRVGLVGPSGAGKTTFVSLLLRQHDINGGAIMIDGQNIAEVTQDSLRANIAVVPQEPLLFHRTIRENIAYGKPDATQSEIRAVAAKAQALDFILDLPEKFDTLVGERGVKLSGGQKQRVAIARAMLKDAPILVLDEATSALDSESEVLIQKALHQLMEGKTVVAIAHRLSTLREMDRILVLEGGQIVEDGTHDELTKAGGTYQRLWEHQAGGFLTE